MNDGRNPDDGLDGLDASPELACAADMRLDAVLASVDGGCGETEQFKVSLCDTMLRRTVHTKPGWQPREVIVVRHMDCAIVDVGHRHDRRSGARGLDRGRLQLHGGRGFNRLGKRLAARSESSRKHRSPHLLLSEFRRDAGAQKRSEVQSHIADKFGGRLAERFDRRHAEMSTSRVRSDAVLSLANSRFRMGSDRL